MLAKATVILSGNAERTYGTEDHWRDRSILYYRSEMIHFRHTASIRIYRVLAGDSRRHVFPGTTCSQ